MSNPEININNESVLVTVKKLLGLDQSYDAFDKDIIIHINTVFSNLNQMGVGPEDGFMISGEEEKWSDFLEGTKNNEQIKSYLFLKVRLIFDPPANSNLLKAMNETANELESRLYWSRGGY